MGSSKFIFSFVIENLKWLYSLLTNLLIGAYCTRKTLKIMKKYLAEMVGTMVLVLMGCGSAVFAGNIAAACGAGVGTLGVAMAFGFSVIAMAYTIGGISGCHIIRLLRWVYGCLNE